MHAVRARLRANVHAYGRGERLRFLRVPSFRGKALAGTFSLPVALQPTALIRPAAIAQTLAGVAEKIKNFAVIYVIDTTECPDFNAMYELYDPCTVMFFFRNKARAAAYLHAAGGLVYSYAVPNCFFCGAAHHDRSGHRQQQQNKLGHGRQAGVYRRCGDGVSWSSQGVLEFAVLTENIETQA